MDFDDVRKKWSCFFIWKEDLLLNGKKLKKKGNKWEMLNLVFSLNYERRERFLQLAEEWGVNMCRPIREAIKKGSSEQIHVWLVVVYCSPWRDWTSNAACIRHSVYLGNFQMQIGSWSDAGASKPFLHLAIPLWLGKCRGGFSLLSFYISKWKLSSHFALVSLATLANAMKFWYLGHVCKFQLHIAVTIFRFGPFFLFYFMLLVSKGLGLSWCLYSWP